MSKWIRLPEFKVWTRPSGSLDPHWEVVPGAAYEHAKPVRGMQLVVHHRIVVDSDGKVADASKLDFNNKYWIASEKISGLSITPDVTDTRPAAVAKAIKLLEKFSDSQLAAILEREIIKQVKHQLGARL